MVVVVVVVVVGPTVFFLIFVIFRYIRYIRYIRSGCRAAGPCRVRTSHITTSLPFVKMVANNLDLRCDFHSQHRCSRCWVKDIVAVGAR